jgi:hypothetical protein
MLDRYTGRLFSAGRSADDNLYLNRIDLVAGAPVEVKAVEIHLEDTTLAELLPVLQQMQREPGLEHIYVSGDLISAQPPTRGDTTGSSVEETGDQPNMSTSELTPDYAQTSLRKITQAGPDHFTLRYLTAAELIERANVHVDMADLVVVATYVKPATGPTATPLPLPPTPASSKLPNNLGGKCCLLPSGERNQTCEFS